MQINRIELVHDLPKLLRVAAYARVSTGKDAMLHSLSAQVDYYTEMIQNRPNWAFAGVFVDEAITGTKEARPEFQRMLQRCREGEIDLVITKSISRFARNTITILAAVRELKNLGVDVYFEEQNIHANSGDGELMLSILASYAQEESRSVSENCKWRIRNDFKEGKISGMTMFGFRLVHGKLQIVPEEAEIVREIFDDYLGGMGVISIMKKCRSHGFHISQSGVALMLRNEKYQGDMLLQKTVGVDFLEKFRKKNEGEAPQYHVKESHEAIVRPEVFDLVQEELKKQRSGVFPNGERRKTRSCVHPFSSQIICGEFGGTFGSKTWRSTCGGERVKRSVWQCNDKYRVKGNVNCHTPHLTDEQLKHAFITAFNQVIGNKERVIAEYEMMLQTLTDTSKLEKKMDQLVDQHQECYTLLKNCIDQKSKQGSAPEADQHYRQLTMRYDGVKAKIDEVASEIEARALKRTKITAFLDNLKTQADLLTEFDKSLWRRTVEQVVVYWESKISVIFKDGREVVVSVLGK